MKWAGRLMTSVAAVLLTAGGGVQATIQHELPPSEAAWAEAVKANTLEAYADFLARYPGSDHAQSAFAALSHGKTASAERPAAPQNEGQATGALGLVQRSFMII
jgi:hypothetical protein